MNYLCDHTIKRVCICKVSISNKKERFCLIMAICSYQGYRFCPYRNCKLYGKINDTDHKFAFTEIWDKY